MVRRQASHIGQQASHIDTVQTKQQHGSKCVIRR